MTLPRIGRRLAELGQSVSDLLFPPQCRLCRSWMPAGGVPFCEDCAVLIQAEREQPSCPRCGSTVAPFEVSNGRCAECRERFLHVQGTARVGEYYGCLGRMVRAHKFEGQEHYEQLLAALLLESVARADWFDAAEAVVSVPTHWTRRLRRPVHLADALGSMVARLADLPHVPLLRRVSAGRHQIGLSYTDRLENVRGAFAVRPAYQLHGTRLLLVDDVRTSGATLDECAKVLRRGGAAEVFAAVVVTVGGVGPGTAIPASI